jgi:DNA-binding HxlR family transcriptional regulator
MLLGNFSLPLSHKSIIMAIIKEERTRSEYLACPIRQVVSRFGDKWSLLVLFLLNRSESGVLRFNEMRRFMTDCSQKMLSQTLKNLEQSHLVHREVFPEVPPRVEYSLTETGRSLMPVLTALIDWGKEHFDEVVTD